MLVRSCSLSRQATFQTSAQIHSQPRTFPIVKPPPSTAVWRSNSLPRSLPVSKRPSSILASRGHLLKAIFPRASRMSADVSASTSQESLLAVFVYVHVKEDKIDEFKAASAENARNSVQEPGVARFDCIQQQDDPTQFVLVEVYKYPEAPAEHKATAHYKKWAETVADWMAEPRTNSKWKNILPDAAGWSVPASLAEGGAEEGDPSTLLAVHVNVHVMDDKVEDFKAATIANATESIKEPGVARFDFLQREDDPTWFRVVEVFSTPDAPAAHKATSHYAAWADAVNEGMMAEPRFSIKHNTIWPGTDAGWR